jgi:hypothetical protein
MEDIDFNDLDDSYLECGLNDLLYAHWFTSESGWDYNYFWVTDAWEVNRYPKIIVSYKTKDKDFYLSIDFRDDAYKEVCGYQLTVDGKVLCYKTNIGLTLDHFFVMSPSGEFLNGSEEKCINLINRYWNLKAFL